MDVFCYIVIGTGCTLLEVAHVLREERPRNNDASGGGLRRLWLLGISEKSWEETTTTTTKEWGETSLSLLARRPRRESS